jgi:hypothetical protein
LNRYDPPRYGIFDKREPPISPRNDIGLTWIIATLSLAQALFPVDPWNPTITEANIGKLIKLVSAREAAQLSEIVTGPGTAQTTREINCFS